MDLMQLVLSEELPTFFETQGLKTHFDKFIILVQTDKATRVNRIMERNTHLSIRGTLDRCSAQIDPARKVKFCQRVVENNETPEELREKTLEIIKDIELFGW